MIPLLSDCLLWVQYNQEKRPSLKSEKNKTQTSKNILLQAMKYSANNFFLFPRAHCDHLRFYAMPSTFAKFCVELVLPLSKVLSRWPEWNGLLCPYSRISFLTIWGRVFIHSIHLQLLFDSHELLTSHSVETIVSLSHFPRWKDAAGYQNYFLNCILSNGTQTGIQNLFEIWIKRI